MNPLIAVAVGIAGLGLGLLLNPLITRMATDPAGAHPLPPARNAWLGAPPWLGVLVALLLGGMALALYLHYGLTFRALFWLAASALLIVVGAVDWKVRLIDGLVLLVATLLALGLAGVVGVGWTQALFGAVGAGVAFLLFFIIARIVFPGPGVPFGLGDVYLAIFIGALVGLGELATALFYGMALAGIASLGILAARQMGRQVEPYISYGTYLCLGVLLYIVLWHP